MDLNQMLMDNGYNPYSMPDRDFVPLAIVWQNDKKKFVRVGMLSDFLEFSEGLPRPDTPKLSDTEDKQEFAGVSGSKIDASFGISLLKNMFAQMGLISLSTKINFNKIDKIELSYNNVKSDSVDPSQIAHYIKSPPANPPKDDIISDQLVVNRTFIIFDILRSNSFKVKCYSKETADAITQVNIINNIVKDDSTIKITKESDTTLNFTGPGYQTFALRVRPFWIIKDDKGNKKFYFKAKPPSIFENIVGLLTTSRTKSPDRDAGYDSTPWKYPNDSVVFPTGSFFNFD